VSETHSDGQAGGNGSGGSGAGSGGSGGSGSAGNDRAGSSDRTRSTGSRSSSKSASDPVADLQRWLMKAGARGMANQVADNVRRTLGQQQKRDRGDIWDVATTELPPDEPPECQWCPVCQAARRLRDSGPGLGSRIADAGGVFASVMQDAFSAMEQAMKTPAPAKPSGTRPAPTKTAPAKPASAEPAAPAELAFTGQASAEQGPAGQASAEQGTAEPAPEADQGSGHEGDA
jgi:hypothetical protein